jgi:hypothetical protein
MEYIPRRRKSVRGGDIKYNDEIIGSLSFQGDDISIFISDYYEPDDKIQFIKDLTVFANANNKSTVSLTYGSIIFTTYIWDNFITGNFLMINLGWIPDHTKSNFIIDVLTRFRTGATNIDDIIDYYDREVSHSLFTYFTKYTSYEIKRGNEMDPDSFVSNVLGIAYPVSKRPPTSMSAIARSLDKMKVISLDHPNITGRPISLGNGQHAIPITRYSEGTGQGAYYKEGEEEKEYCGTFYYWEPDSHIYLLMGKSLYFPNKIAALLHFDPNNVELAIVIDNFVNSRKFSGIIPDRAEIIRLLTTEERVTSKLYPFDNFFQMSDEYIGNLFYALEDPLDQPLCLAARKAGYDTIILSRMPAQRRIVTELLDTRNRDDSLHNLAWEVV